MNRLLQFRKNLVKFRQLIRTMGLRSTLRYLAERSIRQPLRTPRSAAFNANDPVGRFSYILSRPFGGVFPEEGDQYTLNWVIPDFLAGSGGHTTLFRMVHYLEKSGYSCRIVIEDPCHFPNAEAARKAIRGHFFPLQAEVGIGRDALKPAWATIATSWHTAYTVRDFQTTRHKFYFIQDFEPAFYAMGSEYCLAENTYRFGFFGLTAGDWLAHLVSESYGMRAVPFGFAVDHHIYRPPSESVDSGRKVFFYTRPITERRGFELGMLTLAELAKRLPDVEMVLAGWETSEYRLPFRHRSLGVAAPLDLAYWIGQCDAALILSLTNLSLLPLEAMACGCAVVSNSGANVEWLLKDGENCLLVEAVPESLGGALERVLEDDKMRQLLISNGLKQAAAGNWEDEAHKISVCFDILREEQ